MDRQVTISSTHFKITVAGDKRSAGGTFFAFNVSQVFSETGSTSYPSPYRSFREQILVCPKIRIEVPVTDRPGVLKEWWSEVNNPSQSLSKRIIDIHRVETDGTVIQSWRLRNSWLCKWGICPNGKGETSQIAREFYEFVYEEIDILGKASTAAVGETGGTHNNKMADRENPAVNTPGVRPSPRDAVKNTNPGFPKEGRTNNCINCALATDGNLRGAESSALPFFGKGESLRVIESRFNSEFIPAADLRDISNQLLKMNDGSQGIVYGARAPGSVGHVFNVVKHKGKVYFIDGQSGTYFKPNPSYKRYYLMVTHKA